MMKNIIIILLIFPSFSVSQIYLNIKNKDGTNYSFNVIDIQKITFQNLTNVIDQEKLDNAVSIFKLMQNYPNPFNPSTRIDYQIPEAGNVSVKIYNSVGEIVKILDSGLKDAGYYNVVWDGKNDLNESVASGVYICQVIFNQNVLTKKIMLVK